MVAKRLMSTGDAAFTLKMSTEGVRQHDDELKPMRTVGGLRIYDAEVVERFAAKRAARANDSKAKAPQR